MTLEKGAFLHNRYRIEETISVGGMGAVYRALDETLGIHVAVKENFFSTEEYSRQFRLEATILASLRHPNLPRVTDHFVIPGQGQYLVMDFIEGIDLREIIAQNGSLTEEDVIRVGSVICDALVYLHSRNPIIVHRDIKPGNLKITPALHVVLVDFGLAKISHGEATTTGAQALTPGYAPPEQYGQGTDPRSDIYSLGATLYAALTGKIPEDGLSRAMGSTELTPIRKHNAQISEHLAKVIEHAMAIVPGDRYATAGAFCDALLSAAPQPQEKPQPAIVSAPPTVRPAGPVQQHSHMPSTEMPHPAASARVTAPPVVQQREQLPALPAAQPRRRQGFPVGAVLGIGGVLALAGTAALIFGLGLIKPLVPAQPSLSPTNPTTPTSPPATAMPPSATPAPTFTLVPPSETPTLAPSATPTLAITDTPSATLTATQAPTPLGSLSGQIAFSSEQKDEQTQKLQTQVWVTNSDGSGLRQLTHLPDGACQPDWSPDGKRVVFISPCQGKKDSYPGSSLFIINADGTGLTPLATLPGGDFDPAWSPDGTLIAFTTLRDYNIPHLYLYNLTDNTVKRLSNKVNRDQQPAWSPDGKLLAYETTTLSQPQIWIMTASGENAREFSTLSNAYDFMPAWAPDGSVIIFSRGNQSLLVARQVGDRNAQQFPVADRIYPAAEARFSSDGWWLAFDLKQDGNTDIYIMTRNGANLTRLTTNPGVDFHPAWKP